MCNLCALPCLYVLCPLLCFVHVLCCLCVLLWLNVLCSLCYAHVCCVISVLCCVCLYALCRYAVLSLCSALCTWTVSTELCPVLCCLCATLCVTGLCKWLSALYSALCWFALSLWSVHCVDVLWYLCDVLCICAMSSLFCVISVLYRAGSCVVMHCCSVWCCAHPLRNSGTGNEELSEHLCPCHVFPVF